MPCGKRSQVSYRRQKEKSVLELYLMGSDGNKVNCASYYMLQLITILQSALGKGVV